MGRARDAWKVWDEAVKLSDIAAQMKRARELVACPSCGFEMSLTNSVCSRCRNRPSPPVNQPSEKPPGRWTGARKLELD